MVLLLSVICSVMIFSIIVIVFNSVGATIDVKKMRIEEVKNVGNQPVKKEMVKDKKSLKERYSQYLKNNKRKKAGKKKEKTNKKTQVIEGMLEITGTDLTAEQFSMIKIVLSALFMAIALIVCKIFNLGMLYLVAVMAAVGLIAIILPNSWLKSKAKKRKEKLRQQLPDIMDLLVVSVEAGLGFDAEVMQATRDIQHGMSKKEAYEGLAKRCGVKELTTFLTALIQADQLGISIKSVLKVQAENLRKDRKMRAEEKALKAPVTMLIPMVLFIFPVIFIVLLGPAVINIMDIFG